MRLKVLYMIDRAGAFGGAERFVVGLAAHMPRDRVEPWVCSTRTATEVGLRTLAEAGVPHISLRRTSKWQVHRMMRLVSLLRSSRFDLLHAHKFGSNLWGTTIGRSCGVPVVIAHEHNWSYSGDPLRVWIDREIIGRLATRFVAVSRPSAEQMTTFEGVPARKVLVMPTAYIPHREPSSVDIRTELGLAEDTPLVGAVGGLRPEKAFDVLVEAHAQLIARAGDVHLAIAGDGPYRPELERRIADLGIGRKVHLLGHRTDVDSILQGIDVGVMSSDWEGMPLFVFECMAAGVPLVATAVGGVPDLVTDGRTGLLVPPRDATALARGLERALTDQQLAKRLASAAATRLDRFTIESVATRFAEFSEQIAAEENQARVQGSRVPSTLLRGTTSRYSTFRAVARRRSLPDSK
jgi:glycosyltransferase involved in cell wall biosynthesis